MDVNIINPFLEATLDVTKTMAQLDATIGEPTIKNSTQAQGEVTGFIELSAPNHRGSLAVTFSQDAIFLIYQRMLGEPVNSIDQSICDLAGEITNMVCGGAKQRLADKGFNFHLTQPDVIVGLGQEICHLVACPVISLPITLEKGEIFIEVCINR